MRCGLTACMVAWMLAGLVGCDEKKAAAPPVATGAPAATRPAGPMPDQYAIPWVTVEELPGGDVLRVKVKQRLVEMDLVKVPPGSVEIPALGPDGKLDPTQKQAVQVKGFWMGKTELPWDFHDLWYLEKDLTEDEFKKRAALEAEPHRPRDTWSRPSKVYNDPTYGFGREGYAAISVHPNAAGTFCKWLSSHTGKKYRLPTEAEWIHACRAGQPLSQLSKEDLGKVAWYIENSMNDSLAQESAHPPASKPANAFGLHDMLGNVGEWVMGIDGKMVLKGGSYMTEAPDVSDLARVPHDVLTMQMRDCQSPKSVWWLSDAPHAGFRIVCEDE